jgi:RluA family pseudouridine synthase
MNAGKSPDLKVSAVENGMALIQFVAGRLGLSRKKAKEIIDQRRIFVNGRRVWMARHCLRTGDRVAGSFDVEKSAGVKRSIVLYEDHDYLVVNKPSGIASNGPKSLEQKLITLSGFSGLAACHRLDKDTSGCLVFARHREARERIIPLFAGNEIEKKYEAVIRGRLPKEMMTITTPVDGQKAITRVRLVDSMPAASHVSVTIETGRTHQIRKHFSSIGHPVLGDQQYGTGREVPWLERSIGRQMLHAAGISFINPLTGKSIRCRAEPPADFKDCLKQYHLR